MDDITGCGLFRDFRKATVTAFQQCKHMPARNIVTAVLVAGPVVKVAHVGVIADTVIKLQHGVFRLQDGQLWIFCLHGGILLVLHVARQLYGTGQGGIIHGVAVGIHTLQRLIPVKQCAVILYVYALNADSLDIVAISE